LGGGRYGSGATLTLPALRASLPLPPGEGRGPPASAGGKGEGSKTTTESHAAPPYPRAAASLRDAAHSPIRPEFVGTAATMPCGASRNPNTS